MIEPQNTTIPQAAESRPVKAADAKAVGFGEMLAQSLGLVAQVNPDVVAQIANGSQQSSQPGGGEFSDLIGDETNLDLPSDGPDTGDMSAPTLTELPGVSGAGSQITVPFVAADPVSVGGGTNDPVPEVVDVATPVPALPTTPTPSKAPETTQPADRIWQPMPANNPPATPAVPLPVDLAAVVLPPDTPAPLESIGVPVLTTDPEVATAPAPAIGERPAVAPTANLDRSDSAPVAPAPVAPVSPGIPPQPTPTTSAPDPNAAAPSALPVDLQPAPVHTAPGSKPAATPVPMDAPQVPITDTPAAVGPPAEGVVPVERLTPRVESTIELIPDMPVRIGVPRRVATAPTVVTAHEIVTPIANETGAVESQPAPIAAAEVGQSNATIVQATADVPRPQASALAERVMHAIDLQRTQPPPRSMVVDIPEIEGMRLVVSLGSSGQVHVAPAGGSAGPDSLTPFMDDLSRVLNERGFVMTGDGRRRGQNQHPAEDSASSQGRRPSFRRPARVDNDLRI